MKAVILAGGAGTRLRPLSITRPKPMVRLLDKPLLEHIVVLLRENGFDEILITLQYLPQMIRDYFGDGADWGVSIEYRAEGKPLGTAGCVRACSDFIGGEPVLIISGDAACTINLNAFYGRHMNAGGEASILLKQCLEPLEYGLVVTDGEGRITSFIEKPSEDRVYTDLVNTGIYVIGKSVLDRIPENKNMDFGAELFPKLLEEGGRLYGFVGEGYWNDVGSCSAYLKTSFDFLDPKTRVYISDSAFISPGCKIGPNAVIGSGSRIGPGCEIKNSVVDGAAVGSGCEIDGSIVCSGAVIGDRCVVSEGSVIADGANIGSDSYISEAVRIWPGKTVEAGSRVMRSIIEGGGAYLPRFSAAGRLSGEAVCEINPELALLLGMSKAKIARCGCSHDGPRDKGRDAEDGYASAVAEAFLTGCRISGRTAFRLDEGPASTAAFAGRSCGLDLTLHVSRSGRNLTLSFFDGNGLPIPRKTQRELEAACCSEAVRAEAEACGKLRAITGTLDMHIAAAVAAADLGSGLEGLALAAKGRSLVEALKLLKAKVTPPSGGIIELELSDDGLSLSAADEEGRRWSHGRLLCGLVFAEFSNANSADKCLTLPYEAPQLADTLASSLGGTLYRLGRDGARAAEIWAKRPLASDGLFLALRLLAWLHKNKARLKDLMALIPEFHTAESEYSAKTSCARLLKSLTRAYPSELVSGLRIKDGRGSARIVSQGGRLKILAESYSMEAAWELCSEIKKKAEEIDGARDGRLL